MFLKKLLPTHEKSEQPKIRLDRAALSLSKQYKVKAKILKNPPTENLGKFY